jgi:hypothetical protein
MMGMDDKLSGPLIVCMLTLHAASGGARLQCLGGPRRSLNFFLYFKTNEVLKIKTYKIQFRPQKIIIAK